jgi:hypothetical protein
MLIVKDAQDKITLSALADYCRRKNMICEIHDGGKILVFRDAFNPTLL